jgi:hypothetical protein
MSFRRLSAFVHHNLDHEPVGHLFEHLFNDRRAKFSRCARLNSTWAWPDCSEVLKLRIEGVQITEPGNILALSFWRDDDAVACRRGHAEYRDEQIAGAAARSATTDDGCQGPARSSVLDLSPVTADGSGGRYEP